MVEMLTPNVGLCRASSVSAGAMWLNGSPQSCGGSKDRLWPLEQDVWNGEGEDHDTGRSHHRGTCGSFDSKKWARMSRNQECWWILVVIVCSHLALLHSAGERRSLRWRWSTTASPSQRPVWMWTLPGSVSSSTQGWPALWQVGPGLRTDIAFPARSEEEK